MLNNGARMAVCQCIYMSACCSCSRQVAKLLAQAGLQESSCTSGERGPGRTIDRESFPTDLYQLESLPAVPSYNGRLPEPQRRGLKLFQPRAGQAARRLIYALPICRTAQRPRGYARSSRSKLRCRYGRARSPTTRRAGRT